MILKEIHKRYRFVRSELLDKPNVVGLESPVLLSQSSSKHKVIPCALFVNEPMALVPLAMSGQNELEG